MGSKYDYDFNYLQYKLDYYEKFNPTIYTKDVLDQIKKLRFKNYEDASFDYLDRIDTTLLVLKAFYESFSSQNTNNDFLDFSRNIPSDIDIINSIKYAIAYEFLRLENLRISFEHITSNECLSNVK